MEQSPSRAHAHSYSQEITCLLWNPKVHLPCSQEPTTGLYPKPDESSPRLSHSVSLRSILIFIFHLSLALPSGLFLSGFSIKILYAFLVSYVLHVLPISSSFI